MKKIYVILLSFGKTYLIKNCVLMIYMRQDYIMNL